MTSKEKKFVGSILAFLISAASWAVMEWCDYKVFKTETLNDVTELKVLARETNETLKRVEIEVAKIGEKTKHL